MSDNSIMRRVGAWINKWIIEGCPHVVVDGVTIVDYISRDDASSKVLLDRMGVALRMIKNRSPVVYARLTRHVDRILIMPRVYTGAFNPRRREIEINKAILENNLPWTVVTVLVHEITHARIAAYGIENKTRDARTREEHVCEKRAIAFGKKLAAERAKWQVLLDRQQSKELPTAPTPEERIDWLIENRTVALKELGLSENFARWLLRSAANVRKFLSPGGLAKYR